jgi:hypothetical protein
MGRKTGEEREDGLRNPYFIEAINKTRQDAAALVQLP